MWVHAPWTQPASIHFIPRFPGRGAWELTGMVRRGLPGSIELRTTLDTARPPSEPVESQYVAQYRVIAEIMAYGVENAVNSVRNSWTAGSPVAQTVGNQR